MSEKIKRNKEERNFTGRDIFTLIVKSYKDIDFKVKLSLNQSTVDLQILNINNGIDDKHKELLELYNENLELLNKINNSMEVVVKFYNETESVRIDLNIESNWRKFILLLIKSSTLIKYLTPVNKKNKDESSTSSINMIFDRYNEDNIDSMDLLEFYYVYLVFKRVFLNMEEFCRQNSVTTISASIYNQGYLVSSKYINVKGLENEHYSINDFVVKYVEALLNRNLSKSKTIDRFNIVKSILVGKIINKINLNTLFKGVPGTGKSREINRIIEEDFGITSKVVVNGSVIENILRINIHSCSSNSDLMEGIGVSTGENNSIIYKDKKGTILKFIFKAIQFPNIPFFLILEEVQENSLNQLIGDLIYLIEDNKRVDIANIKTSDKELDVYEHIEYICSNNDSIDYITIPNLIESNSNSDHKLIFPKNIYVMCTTNYRADKKIIEDNLFRRFDVIDIFPDENVIKNESVKMFFARLNTEIINHFSKSEIHCDRNLIGHANWINVNNKDEFTKSLIKIINEFKEIREIEWDDFKDIISKVYKELVDEDNKNSQTLLKDIIEILGEVKKASNYYEIIKDMSKLNNNSTRHDNNELENLGEVENK